MKDYSATEGQEMRSIGISAQSQEMVEMSGGRKTTKEDTPDSGLSLAEEMPDPLSFVGCGTPSPRDLTGSQEEWNDTAGVSQDTDGFHFLSKEGDDTESEEDFEVIPVPDCFNLDVPFEVVPRERQEEGEEEEGEEREEIV